MASSRTHRFKPMDKKAIDGLRNTLIQYNLEAVDLRGVFSQVYNKEPSFHLNCVSSCISGYLFPL